MLTDVWQESETSQRALWQGETIGPEADGWSTDEDEDTGAQPLNSTV